jgi:hypothetical protein
MPKCPRLLASLLAWTLVSCCHIPSTISGLAITEKPLWATDLRTVGFAGEEWHTPAEFEAVRQIAFGSNDELVVASDSGPFTKPNHVHAFALNTREGKVVAKAEWESNSWPFYLQLRRANMQSLLPRGWNSSPSGLQKTEALIPDAAADKVSPDGRYLALSRTIPRKFTSSMQLP